MMSRTIYHNLKPGGRLVSITLNPNIAENDLSLYRKYGLKMAAPNGLQDGATFKATIELADGSIELSTYFWGQETYESKLRQAGFREIRWHSYQVSEEGLKKYGEDYWQLFLARPYTMIVEARK
jgi:hypothetical protein